MLKKIVLGTLALSGLSQTMVASAHTGAMAHGHGDQMSLVQWVAHAFTSQGHIAITTTIGVLAGLIVVGLLNARRSSAKKKSDTRK